MDDNLEEEQEGNQKMDVEKKIIIKEGQKFNLKPKRKRNIKIFNKIRTSKNFR